MKLMRNLLARLLLISLIFAALPGLDGPVAGAAASQHKQKKDKSDSDKRQIVTAPGGNPVLWKQPANVETLDLFYGPGGKKGAPDLSRQFIYVAPDKHGTQKKLYVKDDTGKEWTVKFGPEARPETAATRIVWAMGYHADEDYFVDRVHIEGMPGGGDAVKVRFKRRHHGYKDVGRWTWENNPFVGTREFEGYKVLMVLLNNWDLKPDNNKILKPNKKSGEDSDERIYYVGDLGATFGKTGALLSEIRFPTDPPAGSKDKPNQYAKQEFIERASDGVVHFHYKGKDPKAVKGISTQNAKWMGDMLARLSDKQLEDSFRASGYASDEVSILVRTVRDRIHQLQNLR